MKDLRIKILGFIAVFALITLTSCDDDDPAPSNPPLSDVEENLSNGILNGKLESDFELNPSTVYRITGSFIVDEGATFTIPAGTQVIADAGGTDVYVAVLKGGKINIEGTNSNPVVMSSTNEAPGDWGGLTICGDASTTAGADAEAEVGGFIYGGSNDTDNSGTIKNLVIKGTGAAINSESQYNGISFYAVGSGTTVENIAVLNGADDGVEFFGGSVGIKNLYLENLEDDAVDWTEGWDGKVTNTYISNTIAGFSTAFEADKDNNNPVFENVTAISTVNGTALQFKKESGASITGLYIAGYEVELDMKDAGAVSNVKVEGATADVTLIEDEESKYTFNSGLATEPTVDISGWDFINASITPVEVLEGELTGTKTLNANTKYSLTGSYIVNDGAILNISAGTKINVSKGGTDVYIAVLKGGKININGTETNPVVMSSDNPSPGDWGGLTICGDASTTAGANAEAEVGGFIYGGSNDADNSGIIRNLVIHGTGAAINSESQYNGISFYAVGSETIVENIAVLNGADDGVEFFGGSVSATNIYLENLEDDAVDWTEGWDGTLTNTYISNTIAGFSTAFEGDKDNNNPTFENVTAISTVGGTALQFKKESGGTITGLHLMGYDVDLDMKDAGAVANVQIDGDDADAALLTDEESKYELNSGKDAEPIDISGWTWKDATL